MLRVLCVTLSLTLVVLGASGCNRPRWDTPENAYRSFARALEKGEQDAAYQALSTRTREWLAARTHEVAAASGGAVRDDPAALFFLGARASPIPKSVTVVRQDADKAVLAVEPSGGGPTQEVRLVRESEGWRIHLAGEETTDAVDAGR